MELKHLKSLEQLNETHFEFHSSFLPHLFEKKQQQ